MHDTSRVLLISAWLVCAAASLSAAAEDAPGLFGEYYGEPDLTIFKDVEVLETLDQSFDGDEGRGSAWSGKWWGTLRPPVSGEITFTVESDGETQLTIDGELVVHVRVGEHTGTGLARLEAGKDYPITLVYLHPNVGDSHLRVFWNGSGLERSIVPASALAHSTAEESARGYEPLVAEPERIAAFDRRGVATVPAQHVLVYSEPGRFAAWPANNGIWVWGDEILVMFTEGTYREHLRGHSIDHTERIRTITMRSLDGGQTWSREEPDMADRRGGESVPCPGGIDFAHPDFAMWVRRTQFCMSTDRGRTWSPWYALPPQGEELTARNDYLVTGPQECYFFLSARGPEIQSGLPDQAFCAKTSDGGKTIEFLGWMTQDGQRSVMPASARCGAGHFVSALRRRVDIIENGAEIKKNWIEAVESRDGGTTWRSLGKVADTDTGKRNGNPPSLVRLDDGRLCVVYGYRAFPFGIRARVSADNGRTWGPEIHLRDDARMGDIGYCRSVARPDGNVVSVYYYTTHERVEQHIVATIWDPDDVVVPGR